MNDHLPGDAVEAVLAAQQPAIAQLGRALCGQILAIFPNAVVTVDGTDIGFGWDAGYKGWYSPSPPLGSTSRSGSSMAQACPTPPACSKARERSTGTSRSASRKTSNAGSCTSS